MRIVTEVDGDRKFCSVDWVLGASPINAKRREVGA
jgi:hypothetical protein